VLAPLRLDHLGASGLTVGAAFLTGAAAAALAAPFVGRVADQRGWRLPVRLGLGASAVALLLLPLPTTPALLFILIVMADPVFGASYPPAGAMISDGAERAGLDQGYAFALFNLAWGMGQVAGDAGSAGLAQASSDAVPYALLALLCVATLALISRVGRQAEPASQLS
jgi:MFS family permease